MQETGQANLRVFASSSRGYIADDGRSWILFKRDSPGRVNEIVIYNERRGPLRGARIDGDKAEALALTTERFNNQKPVPGGESTLRLTIEELISNNIDGTIRTPHGAQDLRLSGFKYMMSMVGRLQSLSFKGVQPNVADLYEVSFDRATGKVAINLSAEGKIDALSVVSRLISGSAETNRSPPISALHRLQGQGDWWIPGEYDRKVLRR